MRSLIIYEVEHGETIDPLDSPISGLLARFDSAVKETTGARFIDSTVRVDVPASMLLDSDIPSLEQLHKMNASTFPKE